VKQVTQCVTNVTQCVSNVTHCVAHLTPHCQRNVTGMSQRACWFVGIGRSVGWWWWWHWQVWLKGGWRPLRWLTCKGGSGHLVPQECLRHGLLSVGGRLLVLRVGHGEEVLKLPLQRLKGWPLHWVLMPALKHDVVEGWCATLWCCHPVTVLHLV